MKATATDLTPTLPQKRPQRRWIVVLLILSLGSTIALTTLAGSAQTFALLAQASPFFVLLIVLTQALRYGALTYATQTVTRIFDHRLPFNELAQVTLAAQAANRTFVGGAAGLVIELAYFIKRQIHAGTFAAIEIILDLAGVAATTLLFLSGMFILLANGLGAGLRWEIVVAFIGGVALLVLALLLLLRRRPLIERLVDFLARAFNAVASRVMKKNYYDAARVCAGVAEFYHALAIARRDPIRVLIAFLCALARLGCDALALYFAFRAIGYDIAPGMVLVIFVISTSVSTIAAIPGQIGVYETALAFMSTSLGVPAPVAVGATLLFRGISFWLPIPIGYAAAWNLERQDLI